MIHTKAEFYAEQRAQRTGNHYPQWYSYDEMVESGYTGMVSVRDLTRGERGGTTRAIHHTLVADIPKHLRCKGIGIAFVASPRDNHIILQGEYTENGGVPELRYTFVQKPMIPALRKQSNIVRGFRARLMLRRYLDASSLETIYELIDRHTDHTGVDTPVIEFTSYNVAVGTEGRNTVIWEVRSY